MYAWLVHEIQTKAGKFCQLSLFSLRFQLISGTCSHFLGMPSNIYHTNMPAGRGQHPSKHLRLANGENTQYDDFSKENYDNGGFMCSERWISVLFLRCFYV